MGIYVLIEFKEIEGYEVIGAFKDYEKAKIKRDELDEEAWGQGIYSKFVIEYAEILD